VKSFLKDLNESVEEVVANPDSVEGLAGIYGAAFQIPRGSGIVGTAALFSCFLKIL
jgi:hypothetical protein